MRILHISNHVKEIGNGIVNVAVDLACLQAKDGHNVAIASAGGEYETLLKSYGIEHFQLDQSRTPLNIFKAAWNFWKIIQAFQPDIVHGHMMTGVVLARFLRFSDKYALVATVHNAFQQSAVLMGLGDLVIVVSQAVGKLMSQRGIPNKKIRVVSNGTLGSPRNQNRRECSPKLLQHPTITTVSGMYRRKGIGELIDGFAKIAEEFPEAHLYLVGNGPDRESLEKQALETGFISRIHFEGFQPEPKSYLLASDIFVLVSYFDSSPLVIPEAREVGCAIIGSNVDGIPEALDDGKAGILVPSKDSHTLAETLRDLLSDPQKLNFWKKQASQNIERLNAARVHRETLAVYYELAHNYRYSKVKSGNCQA